MTVKSHHVGFQRMDRISARSIRGFILLAGLSVAASGLAPGQTAGKISGSVRDAETGKPLIGAIVLLVGTNMGAVTDVGGDFFILNIPPGEYDVQSSLVGYDRVLQHGVIVNVGLTTTVDFVLRPETVEMAEIVIAATRPDVEREKTSTSEIIRAEDVQVLAGIRDVGDAIALTADVTDGHFRGGRTGEELYTLQGMGITNPLDNSSAFNPIMSAVEEVEVITSGFGAQYGNAQSGVVNVAMKEGKSDRWRTRVEARMRAPGKKHFGPSVYDPEANPYLKFLLDPSVWKGDENERRYYTQMADQFNSYFGLDTNARVQVAYTMWRYQTKRDLDESYGDGIDNSVEAATGGPISEKLRIFMAFRTLTQWPVFPTEQADRADQVMGNLVMDVAGGAALRLSGAFSRESRNIFPSVNSLGYYNWLWDRLLSLQQREIDNQQIGIRFTQTLSPRTFYELKLNTLFTTMRQGSFVSPDWMLDENLGLPETNYSRMIAAVRSGPDHFRNGGGSDAFRDEKTTTISFEGSLASQVTNSHLINAGAQLSSYLIEVNNRSNTRNNEEGMQLTQYRARPLEAGLYVQDKMEFEGLIANVGLRLDLWAENTQYYTDLFSPYRVVTSDSTYTYDKDLAPKEDTPVLARLQPRIGISFPVTPTTVFHLNYGSFMQRPPFEYVVATSESQASGRPNTFGNPRLEPQITNSYDVGIMQGLGAGFMLDVSGYYKDVKNLIQSVVFTDRGGRTYNTFANRDYADIRGFRVALNKRRGNLVGSINYHFSVATGKSSTPFNASPAYQEEPNTGEVIENFQDVPIEDILLDFDRTHNLVMNLAYITREEWGPEVFGFYPLADFSISAVSTIRSGQPYTYSPGIRQINNKRTPTEFNTNLKIAKKFYDFFGTELTVYCEIFNLFNDRILNYAYIFDQSNSNSSFNITRYELSGIDDPNGIRYLNASNAEPFLVDQSFLIYDNAPRSFNIGIVLDL
jgi:outer membrane receptor protein involved in Fe transport